MSIATWRARKKEEKELEKYNWELKQQELARQKEEKEAKQKEEKELADARRKKEKELFQSDLVLTARYLLPMTADVYAHMVGKELTDYVAQRVDYSYSASSDSHYGTPLDDIIEKCKVNILHQGKKLGAEIILTETPNCQVSDHTREVYFSGVALIPKNDDTT
jgi:hypothetical protein